MTLTVTRQGGNIGAEIAGLDLRQPMTDEQFQVVHQALAEHEVIVLRDQDISIEQQMAFAQRFGSLSIHPFSPNLDDQREVIVLDYSADNPPALTDQWHADETFRSAPPLATVLRALVVPAYGGDTVFSSMTAAYRGLSTRMKQYIHGLEARHDFKPWRHLFKSTEAHQRRLRELEAEFPNPWHPVVRLHPVTGRRILNVNPQFTTEIRGLRADEGQHLLAYLYAQAHIPEYQFRVRWQPHTLVMWDNRSVQHYAPHDYYPQRRTMNRVTIAGDQVIGVTGDYTPQVNEEPLPDGKQALSQAKKGPRPIREFERHITSSPETAHAK